MKELNEKLNDLKDRAENILNAAKAQKRAVTKEEKEEFDNIMEDISNVEATIEMEEKVNMMEKKEIKQDNMTKEEKEIHDFANIIRDYNNATQMTKGDNGVLIGSTIVKKIIDKVTEISPLVARATRYTAKGNIIIPKVDASSDDISCDYAEEFSELVEKSNKFSAIELKGFLTGSLAKVSKSLLKNSDFDLVQYVIDRMALKFKVFFEKEGLNGTDSKILGIGKSEDYENMKFELSNNAAITSDELIDVQEQVPDIYQIDACWIMNKETRKAIRKLKDNDGNYLLNRVFNEKWNYELLGKPVFTSANVAKLGEDSKNVIYYGDFSGLAIHFPEELEITVLKEKYATQHAIGVCGYSEVDEKVENPEKIVVVATPAGE